MSLFAISFLLLISCSTIKKQDVQSIIDLDVILSRLRSEGYLEQGEGVTIQENYKLSKKDLVPYFYQNYEHLSNEELNFSNTENEGNHWEKYSNVLYKLISAENGGEWKKFFYSDLYQYKSKIIMAASLADYFHNEPDSSSNYQGKVFNLLIYFDSNFNIVEINSLELHLD